jgi:hypothetical protein
MNSEGLRLVLRFMALHKHLARSRCCTDVLDIDVHTSVCP